MELLIPRAMSSLIDIGLGNRDLGHIKIMLFIMLSLTLLSGATNIIAHLIAARYSNKASTYIREKSFEKIQAMNIEAVEDFTIQSLMTRVTGDTDSIQRMLEMMVRPMVRAPLLIIGGLVLSSMISLRLTAIIFVGMSIAGAVSYSIYLIANPLFRKIQRKVDSLTRIIREGLTGIRLIKVLNKEKFELARVEQTSQEIKANEVKAGVYHGFLNPLGTLIANITMVIILFASKSLIIEEQITIGEITALIQYLNLILIAMRLIPRMFLMLSRANVSAERMFAVLDSNETYHYGDNTVKDTSKTLLVVKDLSYNYPRSQEVLSGLSFTLKAGEKIGILGDTGTGKSTLTSLLLGLYPLYRGQISLYGQEISSYDRQTLRTILTASPQKANIYSSSIQENIVLHTAYDKENLAKVIRVSQLEDFVSQKEEGLAFILEQNGKNLSGGQRQRLNVARTLYTKADLMIFDDIASGLDYKTERNLHAALRKEYSQNSFIFMSQNIRTVQNCDRIYLLKQGTFVAQGTHEELLQQSPLYQSMWQLQNIQEDYR